MKVGISGWNGFLANKLRTRNEIEWVNRITDIDYYLHLGSPIFTETEISRANGMIMHDYVKHSMELIDSLEVPIIFGSSTGVNDIQYNHSGSTSYNLSKLFLENYIVNRCDNYMILRIGSIISSDIADVHKMKSDRLQPRIFAGQFTGIPYEDYYLDVNTFVDTTIDSILNFKTGIVEYTLKKMTIPALRLLKK